MSTVRPVEEKHILLSLTKQKTTSHAGNQEGGGRGEAHMCKSQARDKRAEGVVRSMDGADEDVAKN